MRDENNVNQKNTGLPRKLLTSVSYGRARENNYYEDPMVFNFGRRQCNKMQYVTSHNDPRLVEYVELVIPLDSMAVGMGPTSWRYYDMNLDPLGTGGLALARPMLHAK